MYREHQLSRRLRPWVECLWTSRTVLAVPQGRVFPDGCVDIIYFRGNGRTDLRAVGAMTQVHAVATPPDFVAMGIRFRPGAGRAFLGLPLGEATDRSIPLRDLWGSRAKRLEARLTECVSTAEVLEVVEAALVVPEDPPPANRALLSYSRLASRMPDNGLPWGPDQLAREAELSSRHFRRVCLDETGLTPKRLCRILRFRGALERIRAVGQNGAAVDFAGLAAEAGFYDQAHLIREFREFAGSTPAALVRRP